MHTHTHTHAHTHTHTHTHRAGRAHEERPALLQGRGAWGRPRGRLLAAPLGVGRAVAHGDIVVAHACVCIHSHAKSRTQWLQGLGAMRRPGAAVAARAQARGCSRAGGRATTARAEMHDAQTTALSLSSNTSQTRDTRWAKHRNPARVVPAQRVCDQAVRLCQPASRLSAPMW
jgi:hypothetical protein